jgi:hypothetical protein
MYSGMSVAYRKLERRIKRSTNFEPCLPRSAKAPLGCMKSNTMVFASSRRRKPTMFGSLPATGMISPTAIR